MGWIVVAGTLVVALSACAPKLSPLQERAWDAFKDCKQKAPSASALLIVDTGASATILTPRLLQRLDLVVPADAPRRTLTVMGGEKLDVPFIRVTTIGIGDAVLKDREVGVWDVDPQSPILGGLLGGDILHRFRVMLDRVAKRMLLEPLGQ